MPYHSKAQQHKDAIFLIVYLLTWLSGALIFLIGGNKSKRIRFHAVQAVLLGISITIIGIVLGLFTPLLSNIVLFLMWLYGMYVGYRAYEGEDIAIPVIGDYAIQYSR